MSWSIEGKFACGVEAYMRVIAFYLPQFHRTPENDEWWGEGFTEWSNIRSAKPLYEGHYQPRVPKDGRYYDLLDENVMEWQAGLAKKYGVYGFCVYHYWSVQGMLLNRPMENYLGNKNLTLPFCFCWANETWTNQWACVSSRPRVLWSQEYGDEAEWKRHFEYLLPFFKDERYIREQGKPLLVIYRPERIPRLGDMLRYLDALAVESGFSGLAFASQQREFYMGQQDDGMFTYKIEYQPNFGEYDSVSPMRHRIDGLKDGIIRWVEGHTPFAVPKVRGLVRMDYDTVWESVLKRMPSDERSVPGAFVDWDNTPRYGGKGKVYDGANPDKFYQYFKRQIIHAKRDYGKDLVFLFAWNEWSEGGYLEPDERWGTGYLEALRRALEETGELPGQSEGW